MKVNMARVPMVAGVIRNGSPSFHTPPYKSSQISACDFKNGWKQTLSQAIKAQNHVFESECSLVVDCRYVS